MSRQYGYKWLKLRKVILKRDKGLCQMCLEMGRVTQATDVDHVKRVADGGTDDMDNLQSLCRACHNSKTKAENSGGKFVLQGCSVDGTPIDPNHHWTNK